MPVQKIIRSGPEWHAAMKRGAEQLGDLVGNTMGPKGGNVAITRKYRSPMVTNDGVTVARNTYLEDEVEDVAAQILVEIAMKTNEQAGDGTTGSIVEAVELVLTCLERMEGGLLAGASDPMTLMREIERDAPKVVELLQKMAMTVDSEKLRDIVTTSLENREFAEKIAAMIEAVGEDGRITVEDNWETRYGIETELVDGMKFFGTYATPYVVNASHKRAIWEDAQVLITNEHLPGPAVLGGLLNQIKQSSVRKLVILAEKFETALTQQLAMAAELKRQGRDVVEILPVKCPSLTTDEFLDVATYLEATFFDKNKGMSVKDANMSDLGYVARCVTDADETVLTGGRGDTSARKEQVRSEIETEKDPMFKAKKEKRLAQLSAGIGIIRVGAATEQERTYQKYKIEDAVHAARAAVKEGYVPGAGAALKAIAEELGPQSILYRMLRAPYQRIIENAGGHLEVPDWVIDPVKVVRIAFQNACSAAGALITTQSAITEKRQTILDLLEKQILAEEEDFREYAEKRDPNGIQV